MCCCGSNSSSGLICNFLLCLYSIKVSFLLCINPSTALAWRWYRSLFNLYLFRLNAHSCIVQTLIFWLRDTQRLYLLQRLRSIHLNHIYLKLLCSSFCPYTIMHTNTFRSQRKGDEKEARVARTLWKLPVTATQITSPFWFNHKVLSQPQLLPTYVRLAEWITGC